MPLPQANSLESIVETVRAVAMGKLSMESIAEFIGMEPRQGAYYRDAAVSLGLLRLNMDHNPYLTERGQRIIDTIDIPKRNGILRHSIQGVEGIQILLDTLKSNPQGCSVHELEAQLGASTDLAATTLGRRFSTLISWLTALHLIENIPDQKVRYIG